MLAVLLIIAVCLAAFSEAARRSEQPFEPSDIAVDIVDTSIAHQHAHQAQRLLQLPPHYFTRVDPPDFNVYLRTLVHLHSPDARFMLDASQCSHSGHCLLISPYRFIELDGNGEHREEKMIMMLRAERNQEIETTGLLHLPRPDHLHAWTHIQQMATESRDSLESRYPAGLFNFPEVPEI